MAGTTPLPPAHPAWSQARISLSTAREHYPRRLRARGFFHAAL